MVVLLLVILLSSSLVQVMTSDVWWHWIFSWCWGNWVVTCALEYTGFRGSYLDLSSRLDIAVDVAHAVTYLHMYAGKIETKYWFCYFLSSNQWELKTSNQWVQNDYNAIAVRSMFSFAPATYTLSQTEFISFFNWVGLYWWKKWKGIIYWP